MRVKPGTSEQSEQEAFVDYCGILGVPVVHVPNEGKRTKSYGAAMKRAGMRKGFPDLFIPLPRGEYHGLFIEMKHGKNNATDEQIYWLRLLSYNGYKVAIAREFEGAKAVLNDYLRTKGETK